MHPLPLDRAVEARRLDEPRGARSERGQELGRVRGGALLAAWLEPAAVDAYKKAWQDVPGEHRANLRRIIVTQGDTEPASVEQQRHLGRTCPSLYDLRNLFQVNVEEGRHLWAMVYLLQKYFGRDGREEADDLLRRRSGDADAPLPAKGFVPVGVAGHRGPERCERLVLVSSGGLGREVSPLLRSAALPGRPTANCPISCLSLFSARRSGISILHISK